MTKISWRLCFLILWIGFCVLPRQVFAQNDTISAPDLTGLTPPRAAAILNRIGFNLGKETAKLWTAESGLPQNAISAQSIPPGQKSQRGTAIDVTVLRPSNLILLYDDKSLTLANQTGDALDLTQFTFNTLDGTKRITFQGTLWQADQVDNNQCAQIAAVRAQGPTQTAPCAGIQTWFWTTNAGNHFWIGINGVTRFDVVQAGIERGTCNTAPVGAAQQRCDIYLNAEQDAADYVYFAYTPDQLVVINKSADKWMPLNGDNIINYAPAVAGSTFAFADPKVFGNPVTIGQTDRLAPNQCLLYTNRAAPSGTAPEPCDVIARLDLEANVVFWTQDFDLNSVTDDVQHTCPAATSGKVTVCIMPR